MRRKINFPSTAVKQHGFTLIEVAIVITLLIITLGVGTAIQKKKTMKEQSVVETQTTPTPESAPPISPVDKETQPELPPQAEQPPQGSIPTDLKPWEVCVSFVSMELGVIDNKTVQYYPEQKELKFEVRNTGQLGYIGIKIKLWAQYSISYNPINVIIDNQVIEYRRPDIHSNAYINTEINKYTSTSLPVGGSLKGNV